MKPAVLIMSLAAATLVRAVEPSDIAARLKTIPDHPRLFLKAGGDKALDRSLSADPVRARLRANLVAQADGMLPQKPVERVLTGRRLLSESRTALARVLHLGLAYRLTGDRKYAERARAEMLAAASFSDWNPSHFLDVAEMTAALGIGYDWLYSYLNEGDRNTIRDAIVEKGLKASEGHDSWKSAVHNWNQVCNGGMTIGALAIAESDPALAARMIAQAVNTVPLAMQEYAPDGAYPEGASYWNYGTTYNVILISALQSALGDDFGLSRQPGFLATADFRLHVAGPTGLTFNYSDAGRAQPGLEAAMFWFAAQRKEPYLLWTEWQKLEALGAKTRRNDRADPFLPLWLAPGQTKPTTPPPLFWTGRGATPVAFHRTGWDPDAVFVAIKGGSPSTNHAHMDTGTFVMDADGVRWADDLGSQDYNSLESAGIDLWSKGQNAGRWKVFRLGTSSHNVLMVDGAQQRVDGKAPIVASKPGRTVVDLSEIYKGQLEKATRGIELRPDRTVLVQDEFSSPAAKSPSVRWAMLTTADVEIEGPGRANLMRDGKKLQFRVLEPAGATLKVYTTDPPPAPTDAANPGTRMLGFEVAVPAGASQRIRVLMVPPSAKPAADAPQPLSSW